MKDIKKKQQQLLWKTGLSLACSQQTLTDTLLLLDIWHVPVVPFNALNLGKRGVTLEVIRAQYMCQVICLNRENQSNQISY
jgi:hypothetical protein